MNSASPSGKPAALRIRDSNVFPTPTRSPDQTLTFRSRRGVLALESFRIARWPLPLRESHDRAQLRDLHAFVHSTPLQPVRDRDLIGLSTAWLLQVCVRVP